MSRIRATPSRCAEAVLQTVPLTMRLIRARMREGRPDSLSVPQFRILFYLRRAPGSSLTGIAQHLGVTLPTASHMARRLTRKGFLLRSPAPEERRRLRLSLSASGHRHVEEARKSTRSSLSALLAHLPPDRLSSIVEGLGSLRRALQEAEA